MTHAHTMTKAWSASDSNIVPMLLRSDYMLVGFFYLESLLVVTDCKSVNVPFIGKNVNKWEKN